MRLILIRESIITLLLLSLMLTTASPPFCLSFSMTISLCLPAQRLSHCQSTRVSLTLSLLVPLCELASCLPVCLAIGLIVLPVLKHVLLSFFESPYNKQHNYLFLACPSDTHIQGRLFPEGTKSKQPLEWQLKTNDLDVIHILPLLCLTRLLSLCLFTCLTLCI